MTLYEVQLDKQYPVGAIYLSVNDTNPSELFGGEWTQIKDKFLLACGNNHPNGATGGSERVTLTANQSGLKAHGHGMAHTHQHHHSMTGNWSDGSGSGSAYTYSSGRKVTTRNTGDNATASSKSTTDNNTSSNASESHENMPPYLAVYVWVRTA